MNNRHDTTYNVSCTCTFCHDVFCVGSDGRSYMFLLKGHEDLRQDERVMQLFGLVNTLLDNDPETFKRHLRYTIQNKTYHDL